MYDDIESAVINNDLTSDYFKKRFSIIRLVVSTCSRYIFKRNTNI